MKKILFISLFISFKMFGQNPKMEVIVPNFGETDGIVGVLKTTSPNYPYSAVKGRNFSSTAIGWGVYGTHDGYGTGVGGFALGGAGVTGNSTSGIGGRFSSTSGYALITGTGRVGIGTPTPTAQIDVVRGTAPDGTAIFRGTTHVSHFNYATNEDTYIRGGKDGSKVLINDVVGLGSVGIGHSNPNELLDVNGRMRIRHNVNTAGLWLSNSTNGLTSADGAFFGMETDNKVGFYIGNAWRFGVNSTGEISTTSMAGSGSRMVLASANGVLLSNFQPQVWSIAGGAFTPETSGSANFIKGSIVAYYSSGSATMVAPVNLPTGVKISEIKVFYQDNSSNSMTIKLIEQYLQNDNVGATTAGPIGTFTSTNVAGIQSVNLTLFGTPTIDNANRAYYFEVNSTNWDSNLRINSIKITYSY